MAKSSLKHSQPSKLSIKVRSIIYATLAALFGATNLANAQAASTAEMAKQLSNPISSLISVPLQYNYDTGFGTANGSMNKINIQPVVPFSISENWNVISRTILPVISQNDVSGNSGSQSGLGDTLQSFWFSPKKPTSGGLIWGVGPVIYIPTATDPLLGASTWGGGITGVALKQSGAWTYGGLANHVWSIGNSKINNTFLQPFLSYTTSNAVSYTVNSESTYNWNANEWSVPINFMISKVTSFGNQPVSLQAGVGYYAASSTGGADGVRGRLAMTFLFPK